MFQHILVPLDGSLLAEEALPFATRILKRGGKLTLLSVIQTPLPPVYEAFSYYGLTSARADAVNSFGTNPQTINREVQGYLDRLADKLQEAHPIHVETQVDVGEPASVIAETAEQGDVDAIVMSTHGRSGVSRWLFGSVTQRVLEARPCPVLVVPSKRVERSEENASAETHQA